MRSTRLCGSIIKVGRPETRRLAKIYNRCFAESPWREIFESGEAATWLRKMIGYKNSIACAWDTSGGEVGAIFAFPVRFKPDVVVFIPAEIDVCETMYVADIFVKKMYRKRGIASLLHDECLQRTNACGFTHALIRTNLESNLMPLLRKSGYELIGEQDVVSNKLMINIF